jgi:TRAP-type C4-dicarboxylate transport system permease small subunit
MRSLLKNALKIIDRLTTLSAVIGGVLIAVMTAIVTIAVITRYLLRQPLGWSEEASIYLMIWAIFLGTAYTLKHDAHIGVDLLMNRLSPRIKLFFHCFHYLTGLLFLSILFFKGIDMINLSIMLDSRSIATDFPLYLVQLAVPVGAALLILQIISNLVHVIDQRPKTEKTGT